MSKNEYTASNIILNKTCNQLTWEDVYTIVKENGTQEDKNELKAMLISDKNSLSTIRSWCYFKFIKKNNAPKSAKNDWVQKLLDL